MGHTSSSTAVPEQEARLQGSVQNRKRVLNEKNSHRYGGINFLSTAAHFFARTITEYADTFGPSLLLETKFSGSHHVRGPSHDVR